MSREYYIFGGTNEEGPRGWNDYICCLSGAQATMEMVGDLMFDRDLEWIHVVDASRQKIVYRAVRYLRRSWLVVPHSTDEDVDV